MKSAGVRQEEAGFQAVFRFAAAPLVAATGTFLEDFQRHWPTDGAHSYVDFVRDGLAGNGAARSGSARWKRLTEERAGPAKSVFHFDVQGQVAKSTHAGIPWLLYLKRLGNNRAHFWPPTAGGSRWEVRQSSRSVRPCGSTPTPSNGALPISMTLSPSRPG